MLKNLTPQHCRQSLCTCRTGSPAESCFVGLSRIPVWLQSRQIHSRYDREQQQPLLLAFVDLSKAFDLVSRSGLFQILQKISCPPKLLAIIAAFHKDMQSTVCFNGATSDAFPVSSGAPRKTKTFIVLIRELLFADDAALSSHSEAGLLRLVDKLSHACKEFGLTISLKKTNILVQDAEIPPVITINSTELEVVDSFTFLGSTVPSKASLDVEISSRIAKAAGVMAKLNKRVWNNDLLSVRTELQVYRFCVPSTLLYGSESWPTYTRQEKRLNGFHLCCLRRLLQIKWSFQHHCSSTSRLAEHPYTTHPKTPTLARSCSPYGTRSLVKASPLRGTVGGRPTREPTTPSL
ncbi:hypothetical protein ACROYT_G027991 [Oculina patagonica]